MANKILKFTLLIFSLTCATSCPILKHYTLKFCTYYATYYVPNTRSFYDLTDSGLLQLRKEFKEVYGEGREPVFNEDFYCQLKLLPQYTLHIPAGGAIRKEAFSRRVNEIGRENATFNYVTNVSDLFEVTTQNYQIHGSTTTDFEYKFWYYDENLANNFVSVQNLELLLDRTDIKSLDKACSSIKGSWNNNDHGKTVGYFEYDTIIDPDFLDEQAEIKFDTNVKTDTINIFVFIYDKAQVI